MPRPGTGDVAVPVLSQPMIMSSFWAEYCAPCRVELPALDDVLLANATAGKVAVIGVDTADC